MGGNPVWTVARSKATLVASSEVAAKEDDVDLSELAMDEDAVQQQAICQAAREFAMAAASDSLRVRLTAVHPGGYLLGPEVIREAHKLAHSSMLPANVNALAAAGTP